LVLGELLSKNSRVGRLAERVEGRRVGIHGLRFLVARGWFLSRVPRPFNFF
jgi:hypothetical protein